MSDGITERKNNFEDYYKTDDLDDSELQARLYAEIYYESNVEGGSGTAEAPRTIEFDRIETTNVESKSMQRESEEQPSAPRTYEATGADPQKTHSADQAEFAQVDTLAGREMNPAHECDNERSLEEPSIVQGQERTENSSKKRKFSKCAKNACQESSEKDNNDTTHSKYNVVSKGVKQKRLLTKQTNKNKDNSDSEESVFEVPIPPKPKPPLIDLQDSDEESKSCGRLDEDDVVLRKWSNVVETDSITNRFNNCESEILEAIHSHQDSSTKRTNTVRLNNKDTANPSKSIETSARAQNFTEDIVLNCTTFQTGANSINEIRQLSKSVRANQESKSTEDSNQSKRASPQNKSKGNNENANLQQETSVTSGRKSQVTQQNVYNLRRVEPDKTLGAKSCNPVNDRKRRCNNDVDSQSKQKRQCIVQQDNQNVTPQSNSGGQKRNVSSDFFESMSEEMKNYYNTSRGQENFDVGELQQGMSKDPRMWAILDEDIMPSPTGRRIQRFWNTKCTNCQQEGHRHYMCPMVRKSPCCYMCGMKGHTESRCPRKMCLTCGHEQEQCPDLWRRYHQTTDMTSVPQDPGNVMKPWRLLYCPNCAKRGHESSACREYRWSEHFPTPAAVTNYTDGPTYTPSSPRASTSSGPNPETGFSSEARENEISTLQSATEVQQTMTEDAVSFPRNVNTLSSNNNFCTSRRADWILQIDGLRSFMANWPTDRKTIPKPIEVRVNIHQISFASIVWSYGVYHNKHHNKARMIVANLTKDFAHRKSTLQSLAKRAINPGFLKALKEKEIEFELKIGFINSDLTLLLIATKEYIKHLYDLFRYWLNLPDDEKDYGIDVTASTNPTKMYNLLQGRMPQLEKMRFTCYADYVGNISNPLWLYKAIKNEKNGLKRFQGSRRKHLLLRRNLMRSQIKLLMIVNTEPEPNCFVRMFEGAMKRFKSELNQMGHRLDTATYLGLLLLYNYLFVPHTPEDVHETLRRMQSKEDETILPQAAPETHHVPDVPEIREQENLNSSTIINQQNNELSADGQNNKDDTLLETGKVTDRNCDETIVINDSLTEENSPNIPLNTEPVSDESRDPNSNEDQLSTGEVNIESTVSVDKQNANVYCAIDIPKEHSMKKSKKQQLKEEKKRSRELSKKKICSTASNLVEMARALKLPHMIDAADAIQKRISNQTVMRKHVKTLSKLIELEKFYQTTLNNYFKVLKS
ncbi:PREDICTED: uncharacterized protein LOC105448969 isoform X2 [Wasmannia auropunctata]|uniref:uncharacterized protein LOC105448969 isoform X2 n=1 Tax=Wasmannia auropunctata TaxID=64793 RepID=UPI0005ED49F9|nr:PREDICTED: uncharacterized protein LOC105448969 isoform X2 [Wasmannia auropunctata]